MSASSFHISFSAFPPHLSFFLLPFPSTRYVVTTNTLEKDVGIENLNRVIEKIRAKVTASEGRLEVKMAPKVVSQRDEADLQAMIKRIEEENEEVDGDAPEDA